MRGYIKPDALNGPYYPILLTFIISVQESYTQQHVHDGHIHILWVQKVKLVHLKMFLSWMKCEDPTFSCVYGQNNQFFVLLSNSKYNNFRVCITSSYIRLLRTVCFIGKVSTTFRSWDTEPTGCVSWKMGVTSFWKLIIELDPNTFFGVMRPLALSSRFRTKTKSILRMYRST